VVTANGVRPFEAVVRAYNVGFGDCFLLTFRYTDLERHILIDFGTTARPPGAPDDLMGRVAADIAQRCGGKLDAVVATHRHQDHISGFATSGSSPGAVIAGLKPDLVLQPWTERPDLDPDAAAPAGASALRAAVRSLASMQRVAKYASAEGNRLGARSWAARELSFLGEDNIKNASAVRNLMKMGRNGRGRYLAYGDQSGLETLLPGVSVTVLGPPTAEQSPGVYAQRAKDADEYWHLAMRALESRGSGGGPLFEKVAGIPPRARWFAARVRDARGESLLELVRALDKVLNNTSLILLFEVNGEGLLFPGDAQIENWSYALFEARRRRAHWKQLRRVALYKVGHHGSLNATPKTLWGLFDRKGDERTPARLKTLMSTLADKHGDEERGTEVPRAKLVNEMRKRSELVSTEGCADLARDVPLKL
jgi:hypothetical protein